MLITHSADPNIQGWNGITPLHHTSMKGRIEIVRLLIKLEANVEVKDDEGWMPLDYASIYRDCKRNKKTVKFLSEHLANVPCSRSNTHS